MFFCPSSCNGMEKFGNACSNRSQAVIMRLTYGFHIRNFFRIQHGCTKSVTNLIVLVVEYNFFIRWTANMWKINIWIIISPQQVCWVFRCPRTCCVFGLLCDVLNEGVEAFFTRRQILTQPLKGPQVLLQNTQKYLNFKISFLASGLT